MLSRLSGDRLFAIIVIILIVGGFAMFASASLGLLARAGQSPWHVAFQQIFYGLIPGMIALIFLRFIPPRWITRAVLPFYIFSILATLVVFIPHLGFHTNGATRWIQLGPITIQPAEFLKIAVVLMLAAYLSQVKNKIKDLRYGLLGFAIIVGIPSIILIAQPNTSTTLVLGATACALYFLSGAPWRDFAIIVVVAIIALGTLVAIRPYLLARVTTYLHPTQSSLSSGYQIQQSLIAIGSGRLVGRGFGQSVQKFNYLPEPNGDSIFAVYGEEFGFVGCVILLAIFVLFAARGLMIAAEAATTFGALTVTGLTLVITLSAFLNIGAMLGVLPLTGLPLPFISQGGTALLAALAAVGIILNIAAHRRSS
ncbi:MAG: putative lipid II flippase FtsW [Candidatus Pacebacteria bacterium]|nr:putative lipid II flippase FtsW [Candidatus Paceibacterota bacterium]